MQRLLKRAFKESDLWLSAVIFAGALGLLRFHNVKSDESFATLVGALLGGALLLLGNWLGRWSEGRASDARTDDRRAKLKVLIAAELVNVTAGLIGAKRLMDAAITSAEAGAQLPPTQDLSSDVPRPMPFTDALGLELLLLDSPDLDALMTLRGGLALTRLAMDEISSGRRQFGLLAAQRIRDEIRHDMSVLRDAFARIAPERELAIDGQPPQLATAILQQLSA